MLLALIFSGASGYEAVSPAGQGFRLSEILGNPAREGTHARLARKSIALFELHYGVSLAPALKEAVVLGAMEEDYDIVGTAAANTPTSQPGVWQELGTDPYSSPLSPDTLSVSVNRTENHFLPRINHGGYVHYPYNEDALGWAKNSSANLSDWEDALSEGDTVSGWRILGHVLHVLQDMSVPDHVRNDYHAFDNVYEQHVGKLSADEFNTIAGGAQPTELATVDAMFTELSLHARTHFFSWSTIFKPQHFGIDLPQPEIITEDENYFVNATANMGNRLCRKTPEYWYLIHKGEPVLAKQFCILNTAVLTDTAERLLPRAIAYGANLIKLFYNQAHLPPGTVLLSLPSPGTKISGIAGDGSGLWVVDRIADKLYKLNPTTGEVVSSFNSASSDPYGLAYNANYLYYLDRSLKKVYRFTPTTGGSQELFGIAGIAEPSGLAFNGTYFFITDDATSTIYRYHASGTPDTSFLSPGGTASALRNITWDGSTLRLVSATIDLVHNIDINGTMIGSFTPPSGTQLAIGWDTTHLWICPEGSGTIYKVSP